MICTTRTDTNRHPQRHSPAEPRAAFTIIELMVVIIIIGILMAFLLPAIGQAIENARIAEVTTEMNRMEAAIAEFESRFGVQPPSGIVLYEMRDDGTAGTPDPGWGADTSNLPDSDLQRRTSRALIRQIWPDFNFGVNHDFNGNGSPDGAPIYMNGAECLVLFLGGVKNSTRDSVVGFSANPLTPIQNNVVAENRVGPFHEFDPGRFVDLDGDLMFEYLDPLGNQETPMLYFSSYDGRGYKPHGIDLIPGTDDDEILPISLGRGPISVYFTTDTEIGNAGTFPDGTAWNPDSFQIWSPGRDGLYGHGGEYTSDFQLTDNPQTQSPAGLRPIGEERDNITNFRGRLE